MTKIAAMLILPIAAGLVWSQESSRSDAGPSPIPRLLRAVERDPSFKVRMQAIRILRTKLPRASDAHRNASVTTLGRIATTDRSPLVRALACLALGDLDTAVGNAVLDRATRDPARVVRAFAVGAAHKEMVPPARASTID